MIPRQLLLRAHPATLVLASFLFAIAVGTSLLELGLSTVDGHISFIDALFTATSAVCVTGLVVVDTGTYFTSFGQCVILGLIQIGGLGIMTISVALFRWIGRNISFRQRMAMQDLFAHTPREDILSLVKSTFFFTFGAEILGTILFSVHWSHYYSVPKAIYVAVFHSISAFCNAGFSLFASSMTDYRGDLLLNFTMCALIVTGGIGFPVLYDLQSWFRGRIRRERVRLSIQTKTVLITTLILIVGGALVFSILEGQAFSTVHPWPDRVLIPLFQSVTCRTAGFNTVDISSLREATLVMMIFLMFFGASPGSCGGGVKTTTLALIAAFTVSRVKRKRRVNMFKKSVPPETVTRSVSLILVSIGIIGVVLFLLLVDITEQGSFLGYFFETVSAFGTVGLSTGVTPGLSAWGKFLIILMMIIGRVGVLTFSYIIVGTGITNGLEYSEENLMIG